MKVYIVRARVVDHLSPMPIGVFDNFALAKSELVKFLEAMFPGYEWLNCGNTFPAPWLAVERVGPGTESTLIRYGDIKGAVMNELMSDAADWVRLKPELDSMAERAKRD